MIYYFAAFGMVCAAYLIPAWVVNMVRIVRQGPEPESEPDAPNPLVDDELAARRRRRK